jgi:hypothetical protein
VLDQLVYDIQRWAEGMIYGYARHLVVLFLGGVLGLGFALCAISGSEHRVVVQNGSDVSVEVTVGAVRREVAPGQSDRFALESDEVILAARGLGIDESFSVTLSKSRACTVVYNVGGIDSLALVTRSNEPTDKELTVERLASPVTVLDPGVWLSRTYVNEPFDQPDESSPPTTTHLCRVDAAGRIGCAMPATQRGRGPR